MEIFSWEALWGIPKLRVDVGHAIDVGEALVVAAVAVAGRKSWSVILVG